MISINTPFGSEVLYMARHYFLFEIKQDTAVIMHPKHGARKEVDLNNLEIVANSGSLTIKTPPEVREAIKNTLIESYSSGALSLNAIGRMHGVSGTVVKDIKNKLGLTTPIRSFYKKMQDLTEEEKEILLDVSRKNEDTALLLGLTTNNVAKLRRGLGIRHRGRVNKLPDLNLGKKRYEFIGVEK